MLVTKQNRLLFVLLFLSIQTSAQEKNSNLYFICGHPFENIEQQFESWLFQYNPDSAVLTKVKKISGNKQFLSFIKPYDRYRKIFILKDDWYNGKNQYLSIIDMNNPKKDTVIVLKDFDYTYIDSKLIFNPNSEPFLCLDFSNYKKSAKYIFLGVGVNGLGLTELQPEVFRNSYVIGSTGGAIQSEDDLGVYTTISNGDLSIPKTSIVENRPLFEISLPKKYWNQDGSMKLILLNTDDLFVFKNKESNRSSKEVGSTELLVYSKTKNEWSTLNIKGNRSNVRSFGGIIAGLVQSYDVLTENDSKGQQKVTKFKRVSPGKNARRKEGTTTGAPIDVRFLYSSIYSPGILYLYNSVTNTYFEWNTGQGDSEILLVENNEVYYRVNDEIYKAPILDGKKLGKAKLLIKSEMVPDIHWAFLSK
jgi:hypothetical protein